MKPLTPPLLDSDVFVDFGKHKGTRWTRVPVGYLIWMVGAKHGQASRAQAELDRRGTLLPTVDVSHHAIDRASQRCLRLWKDGRVGEEGLAAWLTRMARGAIDHGVKVNGPDRIDYMGMRFVFENDTEWPVLKTVMPVEANYHRRPEGA